MKPSDVPKRYRAHYLRSIRGEVSPRMAIKLNCLMCVGWDKEEAKLCTAPTCPLYQMRPGTTSAGPNRAGAHRYKRGPVPEQFRGRNVKQDATTSEE